MIKDAKIWLGQSRTDPVFLYPKMANRHGLIAGATGTGKTVTLKVLAESFSALGVPVFLADIKGDLSSLVNAGSMNDDLKQRLESMGISDYPFSGFPVCFWDLFGEKGHPVRTTISEMGPLLLAKLLNLNETQTGVLSVIFRYADDEGYLLLDIKDLRAILQHAAEQEKVLSQRYGSVPSRSITTILRNLLSLEDQQADVFFGEKALEIHDWFRLGDQGKGIINVLYSVKLYQYPALYATFLLWMLSELFETLPEVGDLNKPKMVFFFDEAHLLFNDIPKVLLEKIELVMRLIRSKGVGVYFVTQNPSDIPQSILNQLSNRIQHALRAYTPFEQKQIKAAAQSFRTNPDFDTKTALAELKTGEALVSCLDESGQPTVVQKTMILAPQSSFDTLTEGDYIKTIQQSFLHGKYDEVIDRQSAYEVLGKRVDDVAKPVVNEDKQPVKQAAKKTTLTPLQRTMNSALSSAGREVGRQAMRGILGALTGKK